MFSFLTALLHDIAKNEMCRKLSAYYMSIPLPKQGIVRGWASTKSQSSTNQVF